MIPKAKGLCAMAGVADEKEQSGVIYLKKQHLQEMIAHAHEEAPLEACGILAGKDGRVVKLFHARNADRSPVSYRLEPEEQYRIFVELEERGWDILGIYHSHPSGPAFPSAIDLKQAFYPEAVYVVVSLADPAEPKVRAFRLVDGDIREEQLAVA